jgi:hypothetical protein
MDHDSRRDGYVEMEVKVLVGVPSLLLHIRVTYAPKSAL